MSARSHVPVRLGVLAAALLVISGLVPGVVSGTGAPGSLPGDATRSDQVIVRWVDGSAGTAFGAVSAETVRITLAASARKNGEGYQQGIKP